MTLYRLIKELLDRSALWTHEDLPFTVTLDAGHPRVLLIGGENATGKSLLAQSLMGWGQKFHKIAPISVSIRERSGSGSFEMAGFRRALMFGDEHEQSTGAISTKVIEPAFSTLRARASEQVSAILLLDEPELGLSDDYAGAMGAYLAAKILGMPDLAAGVVIVTHSRSLARELAQGLPQRPSFVKTGTALTFEEWLETRTTRTIEELLSLPKVGHERWLKVTRILESLRKAR